MLATTSGASSLSFMALVMVDVFEAKAEEREAEWTWVVL